MFRKQLASMQLRQLEDRLVSMGFEEQEAEEAIRPQPPLLPYIIDDQVKINDPLPAVSLILSAAPALVFLTAEELARVAVRQIADGRAAFEVRGIVDPALELKLVEAVAQRIGTRYKKHWRSFAASSHIPLPSAVNVLTCHSSACGPTAHWK